MSDTIEKRVDDIEYVLGHLPEDLDARFAGVDTKLAAIREMQALHTTRFSTIERRLDAIERRIDGIDRPIDAIERRLDAIERRIDTIERKMDQILDRLST